MTRFRKVLLKLHLWIGLGAGLLMAFIAVTGGIIAFGDEIDRLLNPSLMTVRSQGRRMTPAEMVALVQREAPGAPVVGFAQPPSDTIAPFVMQRADRVYVDPHAGRILGRRDVRVGLVAQVHQLHTKLMYGRTGSLVVGWTTVLLLFLTISGIVLWWRRMIVATHLSYSWWRINFDLHNLTGIYASVFLLVMSLTGVLITFGGTLKPLVYKVTGEPPAAEEIEVELKKGVPRIGWDEAMAIADKALPGASTTFVMAPAGRNRMFQVGKRFPEDRTPGGRSGVGIHPQTGEVLEVRNSRTAHPGVKVFNWNRPLHTGDVLGLPTRILWSVACLFMVLQTATGFLIWLKRRG